MQSSMSAVRWKLQDRPHAAEVGSATVEGPGRYGLARSIGAGVDRLECGYPLSIRAGF